MKSINDASPGRAIAVVGDVTDPAYSKRVVQKAAEFGNGKIHIIVNNAGYTWDGVIHKVRYIYVLFSAIYSRCGPTMWRLHMAKADIQ